MEMNEKQRRNCFFAMAGFMFLLVWVYGALSPMVADDYRYCYSFATGEKINGLGDIISSIWAHSFTMNGRYLAHFFAQLFLWVGKPVFNVFNAGVYLGLSLLIYRFTLPKKRWDILLYAAILCGLWLFIPAFGQTVLWLDGSCNYLWGGTLMLAWLLPFRLYCEQEFAHSHLFTAGVSALGFVAGCYSENTSAAGLLAAGLCMLWLLIEKRRWKLWMVTSMIAGFAGWLTMILAPANAVRRARSEKGLVTLDVLRTRFMTATDLLKENFLWLLLLFAVLFAVVVCQRKSGKAIWLGGSLFIAALAANYAVVMAPYYPERASFGVLALLMAGCAVLWGSITARWYSTASLAAVLCAVVLSGFNAIAATNSILVGYHLWGEREAYIEQQKQQGNLNIVTYQIYGQNPYGVFYIAEEPTQDPTYWANTTYARYYGLETLATNERRTV